MERINRKGILLLRKDRKTYRQLLKIHSINGSTRYTEALKDRIEIYTLAMKLLAEEAKTFDSVDMPERMKPDYELDLTDCTDREYQAEIDKFNQALDLCKPLIVKLNLRIQELEKSAKI